MSADDDIELFGGLIATRRPAHLALLGDPTYRRFFLASMTSSLGDWVGVLAILALTETIIGQASRAAAFALSGVMIARILPVMILGPVAGVYADRWDRKRTLVATDVGRGLIMAVIPFSQDFFQLFVASFAVEVLSMLFVPAKEATLPNIVPRRQLVQANQLTLTVTYGTLPLGGVLFAAFVGLQALLPDNQFLQQRPEAVAIWANALTFLLSAVLFAGMGIPRHREAETRLHTQEEDEPNAWEELKEGLRFIVNRPRVRGLVGGVMAAAFAGGVLFAVAKLFVSIVGAGQTGFGLLVAVTGGGMLVGLFAAVWAEERFGKDRVFGPGIGIGGLFAAVAAFMPGLWSASAAAFIMGLGAGLAFVSGYTMLQESTGDEVRGRAFAAFNTGVRLALFASLVLAPAVVGVLGTEVGPGYRVGGVRITMALGGLIAVVGAALSARQLQRVKDEPELEVSDLERDGSREQAPAPSGWFVVFEGGEGAGKTTQLRLLRPALEREGFEVVITREPGGTALGEAVRELLLDPDRDINVRTEALLYAAARAQHAEEVIRPALERGAVVLCDRYVDSSIAYQGVGRGLGEQPVQEINRWGTGDLQPDAVVLLDLEAAEGLQRLGMARDRLEGEGLPFHSAVNQAYRRLADAEPGRFVVVDASRPPEEVHGEIRDAILRLLEVEVGDDDEAAAVAAEDGSGDEPGATAGPVREPTADIRAAETRPVDS